MPVSYTKVIQTALCACLLAVLSSCGGGGTVPSTSVSPRALGAAFTNAKAVNYSPYRTSTSSDGLAAENITPTQIKEDLDLLVTGGFTLIRTFDSSDKVAKQTLEVIRANKLPLKVMLGVWIASGNVAASQADIQRGIALATDPLYKDIIVAVSVGNETMVSWSFNAVSQDLMAAYITQVRNAITQPVTTDDGWDFYVTAPRKIMDVIDFASMHAYPILDANYELWSWRQSNIDPASRAVFMMDASIAKLKKSYDSVRAALDSVGQKNMPIVIGETGWKTNTALEPGRAHPVNQKMYFDRLTQWNSDSVRTQTGPKSIFWFEAFDEQWKQGDDSWGLFTKDRKARYVVKDLYNSSLWDSGVASLSSSDAVYAVSLTVRSPTTASRYTVYSDTSTSGEARPVLGAWNIWEGTANANANSTGLNSTTLAITPAPKSWGWGTFLPLPNNMADDLSSYAGGTFNFTVKTLYPGKLEVGFVIGSFQDEKVYEVFMPIGNGEYGYKNDNSVANVSIPLATMLNYAASSLNVDVSKISLGKVTQAFVIADRYAKTGKPNGSNVTTLIAIDDVFWAKP